MCTCFDFSELLFFTRVHNLTDGSFSFSLPLLLFQSLSLPLKRNTDSHPLSTPIVPVIKHTSSHSFERVRAMADSRGETVVGGGVGGCFLHFMPELLLLPNGARSYSTARTVGTRRSRRHRACMHSIINRTAWLPAPTCG